VLPLGVVTAGVGLQSPLRAAQRAFRVSSRKGEFVIMQIIVASLMVVVAAVFIRIAMHAARNPKGRG